MSYYNNANILCWTCKLDATFSYTGKSAVCKSATSHVDVIKNGWSISKQETVKDANVAYVTLKMKYGTTTVDRTLSMFCSKTGSIC